MTKAAVIGVGYLGRYHAEKYRRSGLCELTCVVDVNREAAERVAKENETQAVLDYRRLPELGVTCASVAANTSAHFEISRFLLEHGIDILVEKPMTVTRNEALALIDCAKDNCRILQVGHLERFNPALVAMKEYLTKPCFFEVRRIAPYTGRGTDVDVVMDLMIHDIDIVRHLVGKPVRKIDALGVPVLTKSFDIANARLTFEGGAIANVTASRAALAAERTIRIFQPDVYISLDFGKKRLKIYAKNPPEESDKRGPLSIIERDIEERDALGDEINAFLQAVANRTEPVVTGEDGLRAIDLALQIKDAMREGVQQMLAEMDLPEEYRQMGSV